MKNKKDKEINKYLGSLVSQLFGIDLDIEEKITGYIETFGISKFIENFTKMDLPKEVIDKLESLKLILEVYDENYKIDNDKNSIYVSIGGDYLNG